VLDAAGITFGVIGTLADLADDEQMRQAGALVPYAHQGGLTLSSPVHLAGVAHRSAGPAPGLGQHNAELLREAGYSDEQIAGLQALQALVADSGSDQPTSAETRP
jgi:formyl-CoA transferase